MGSEQKCRDEWLREFCAPTDNTAPPPRGMCVCAPQTCSSSEWICHCDPSVHIKGRGTACLTEREESETTDGTVSSIFMRFSKSWKAPILASVYLSVCPSVCRCEQEREGEEKLAYPWNIQKRTPKGHVPILLMSVEFWDCSGQTLGFTYLLSRGSVLMGCRRSRLFPSFSLCWAKKSGWGPLSLQLVLPQFSKVVRGGRGRERYLLLVSLSAEETSVCAAQPGQRAASFHK